MSGIMMQLLGTASGADPGNFFAVRGNNGTVNNPWNDAHRCNQVIIDEDYNVYSGWTIASNNSVQGALLKQDSSGGIIYKKSLGGSASTNYNSVQGMSFDSAGRLHILNCSSPSYGNNYALNCLDPSDGSITYSRGITVGQPENGNDPSMSDLLRLTSNGKIVCGYATKTGTYSQRIITMLWTPGSSSYTLNRAGQYEFQGAIGTVRGNGPYFVSSYDNKSWVCADTASRNGISSFSDSGSTGGFGISYYRNYAKFHYMNDSTGNWYWSNCAGSEAGNYVYFMKYNASGSHQWTRKFGPATSSSYLSAIYTYYGGAWEDSNGDVYLSMGSRNPSSGYANENNMTVFKLNSSGVTQWARRFWITSRDSYAANIYGDTKDDGSIYLTTQQNHQYFVKYPKDGNLTGSWNLGGQNLNISSDVGINNSSNSSYSNISSGAYNPDFTNTNYTVPTSGYPLTVSNMSNNPPTALNLT